jgi:hypothetical protein
LSIPVPVEQDVIRPLEIPSSPEVPQQAQPAPADQPTAKGFADLHAAAVARDKTSTHTATGTGGTTPANARIEAPEGETWASTKPDAHYARIITGPRTGQYINLTHGERRGQTFSIEHRDGKTLHVYGEGDTEVLIRPSVDANDVTDAAKHAKRPDDQPARNERWAPVADHSSYADILAGPRNGLFVNISGGVRDGMAFQIVKKGDKVFHVYGTGKDRQTIQVAPKHNEAGSSTDAAGGSGATAAASDATAAGTGGSAAPTSD